MKIGDMPGEYAFRALVKNEGNELVLSAGYYLTKQQVIEAYPEGNFIWPVEVQEGGIVYVPVPEEL